MTLELLANLPLGAERLPLQALQEPQHSQIGSFSAGARAPVGQGLRLHLELKIPLVPLWHDQADALVGRESRHACDQGATCQGPKPLGHSCKLGPGRVATVVPADAWPTPGVACEHRPAQVAAPQPDKKDTS